jgi:hypothetical protein
MPIVCFEEPSAVGKTTVAQQLARTLGARSFTITGWLLMFQLTCGTRDAPGATWAAADSCACRDSPLIAVLFDIRTIPACYAARGEFDTMMTDYV